MLQVIKDNSIFAVLMALGSIVRAFIGAQLLGMLPESLLLPLLALALILSAIKVWRREAESNK